MKKTQAVLAGLLLLTFGANAGIVYSQPHNGTGTLLQSSWWDPIGTDYDQYVWDSFRLTTSTPVTAIQWRGGYINGRYLGSWVADFTVAIYGDIANGYQADIVHPPLVTYQVGGNANETPASTFGGMALYDYSFTLPTPFLAQSNRFYWVQIEAWHHGIPDWGFATSSSGNGSYMRRIANVGDADYQKPPGDAAFTLLTADSPLCEISASPQPSAGGSVSGAGFYPSNTTVQVVASPSPGYMLVRWSQNGAQVSAATTYTFTAQTNRTLVAEFAPANVISASATPGAGGSVAGTGAYLVGATVSLSATPAAHYAFLDWTESGGVVSTSPTYTFPATADRTLEANFVPANTNVATVFSQPHNGTSSLALSAWWYPDGYDGDPYSYDRFTVATNAVITDVRWRGGYSSGSETANPVLDFTITIQPDMGAQPLLRVKVGGNAGPTPAGTFGGRPLFDYQFTLPTAFQAWAGTNYWIQIEADQGTWPNWGMAIGSGGNNSHFYEQRGYPMPFSYQTGDLAFSLLAPAGAPCTVTASASPAAGGTVSGGGSGYAGQLMSVTAAPKNNYVFLNWTEGGVPVSTSPTYAFIATTNRSLQARFASGFTIAASASPAAGGFTSGAGTYTNNTALTLSAAANPGYAFVNWTRNGATVTNAADYRFTVSASRTFVANFTPVFSVATAAWPFEGGTTGGDGVYRSGSNVTVTATAGAGYAFTGWTDGGTFVSGSSSYSFAATADRWLDANFVPIFTVTTGSSPADGGTTGGGGAFPEGTPITLSASPAMNYAFVNWTQNGVEVGVLTDCIYVVTAPATVIANFASLLAAPPVLSLAQASPGALLLEWTTNASGFLLQVNPDLGNVNWTNATNAVSVSGTNYQAVISPLTGKAYFRLHHP